MSNSTPNFNPSDGDFFFDDPELNEVIEGDPRHTPAARRNHAIAAARRADAQKRLEEAVREENQALQLVFTAQDWDAANLKPHEIISAAETSMLVAAKRLKDARAELGAYLHQQGKLALLDEIKAAQENLKTVSDEQRKAIDGIASTQFTGAVGKGIFQIATTRKVVGDPAAVVEWVKHAIEYVAESGTGPQKKKADEALNAISFGADFIDFVEIDPIRKAIQPMRPMPFHIIRPPQVKVMFSKLDLGDETL